MVKCTGVSLCLNPCVSVVVWPRCLSAREPAKGGVFTHGIADMTLTILRTPRRTVCCLLQESLSDASPRWRTNLFFPLSDLSRILAPALLLLLFSRRQAIMEINPDHPVVKSLQASFNTQPDADSTRQTAVLLYDIAALTGGYSIDDPNAFAQRVTGMLEDRIGADGAGGVKDAVVSESGSGGAKDAEVAAVEDAEEGGTSDAEVVG